MAPILDLILLSIQVLGCLRFCHACACGFGKPQLLRREVEETGLDCFDGAVDYRIYGIDYVVDEGLGVLVGEEVGWERRRRTSGV